ncbi:MAG: DNA primase, partial [Epsilonproteobacteria bacterium]
AKYVNSPQTKLFNKSRLLYGYNLAKELIYKQKTIIVTEGYLDVIMLHQAGFSNTVATLGTALTPEHLPLLKRGEPKIIVAYDGDKAGLNAAYKASVLLSHSDFMGGVVIFEDGLDPADMVQNNKIDELNAMFSTPIPFIPFAIDFIIKKFNLENPQEKQQALKEANDYLKTLNPILQEEYQSLIARKLNVNSQLIQVQHFNNQRANAVNLSSMDIAELSILKTMLNDKSSFEIAKTLVSSDMFEIHSNEYNLVLNEPDHPSLVGLMINEHLIIYNFQELTHQLTLLLVPYYNKQLQQLTYDKNIDFKQKAQKIRNLKDKLKKLKAGKLINI